MSRSPAASTISHIVFDLDGTLTDTWPIALKAFKAAIEDFAKRPFSDEELVALAGPAEEGILQKLFPDHWRICFERYLEGFERELMARDVLFPGIADLLDEMAAQQKIMAINSGKTERAVIMALQQTGIASYFREIKGGSAVGDVKKERLAQFMEAFGAKPADVAVIGDGKSDMAAAQSVNAFSIGVIWAGMSTADELQSAGADIVFDDVSQFRRWLVDT